MKNCTNSPQCFEFSHHILPLVPANNNSTLDDDKHLLSIGYRLAALIRVYKAVEYNSTTEQVDCLFISSEIKKKIQALAEDLMALAPKTYDGLVIKACIADYASKNGFRNIFHNDEKNFSILDDITNINTLAN